MTQSTQSALALGSNSPSVFNFDTHPIRIIMIDGEPWFACADVAAALGYRDAANAARCLGGHQKGTHNLSTPGGDQKVTIINESGLYRLVLRSRKPEAVAFSDWVTGEVLPSIRKNGGYATEQRMRLAQMLATEATSGVARAVFDVVMAGGNVELDSWLLSFGTNYDESPRPYATLMPRGTFHVTAERLTEWIAKGEQAAAFTNEQLAALAEACASRLRSRIAWDRTLRERKANKAEVA